MHLPKLIPALLLTLLAACSDPPPPVAADEGVGQPALDCKESVHPFWTKFRAAVLAEDMDAIADMTKLPMAKGEPEEISREEFKRLFQQDLKAAPMEPYYRETRNLASMKELMRYFPDLGDKACIVGDTYLRFDRWTFALVRGGWFQPDTWQLVDVNTSGLQKP